MEKEEEEQKRIQKVEPKCIISGYDLGNILVCICTYDYDYRIKSVGVKGKTVMHFASCLENMFLLEFLLLKLNGENIA